MAKALVFKLNDKEYPFYPVKIERKKLYGWTETIALDDEGNECKLVSMDESGTVIIPKGSLGLGVLNNNFEWVDRSEIIAVDEGGNEIEPFPSSFSEPIELSIKVSPEELLNHSINAVYQLDEESVCDDLKKEISNGDIFTFNFNYRDGYETKTAFLVESESKLFMLVGSPIEFTFIGLEEQGYIDELESEDEELSEELGIDFSMM
ncbi:hypothetical protein [Acetivibrio cellulolyticus]|uniref:hypothetical protein n=1 Tax=Acetivibrio cellulolyticus TaxID=35830 RepID=UPI0001E2EC38|nr:hypothetical protein [Acetivibrio cellulolyticus]